MTFKTPPLTLGQAKAVAASIHAIRPDWDRPGIEDALGRARFLGDAAAVAIAAHRAAANSANRTPAIIALDGPHWRDAQKPPHFPAPTAGERCSTCSEREDVCRSRWSGDHQFAPDLRRPVEGTAASHVEGLRAIRENTRSVLCIHGTPLSNCNDCRRHATPDPSPAHGVGAPSEPPAPPAVTVDEGDDHGPASAGESDTRPETACAAASCFRPTRDGICDRCRAKAAAEDTQAANAELVDRLKANERERALTRPEPDPTTEPRYFTGADYDPERVHAAQAHAAAERSTT